jgi:GNAT superfamily N-acetyltransferase
VTIRIATAADIEAMHVVRLSVVENRLGDPKKVTPAHYREMLEERGRGWVYLASGPDRARDDVAGFAIADNSTRSIWALFVKPGYEGRGIGRALHDEMVRWLFEVGDQPLWLSTDPNTRAEQFYIAAGWTPGQLLPNGERRFTRGTCG